MAKIDVAQSLKTIDGKSDLTQVVKQGDAPVPVTLREVCVQCLLTPTDKDANIGGDEKHKRYTLARKIATAETGEDGNCFVSLKSDEIQMLKAQIPNLYTSLVTGQAYNLLEGEADAE